jgi:hypothetical protein
MTEHTEPQPPKGLFARIIRRLGLERQIQTVRKHLGLFVSGLFVALVFVYWIVQILRDVLMRSDFGPFARLAITDPQTMLRHGDMYAWSMLEAIPAVHAAICLAAIAGVMLLVRWTAQSMDSYRALRKAIHEHR